MHEPENTIPVRTLPNERCALCGSVLRWVPLVYGYPSSDMRDSAVRGELALGGCRPGPIDRVCSVCHRHPTLTTAPGSGLLWRTEVRPREAGTTAGQRRAAAIWGHLVGDAIGVPYEFLEPNEIATVELRGGGRHDQPSGTWSDDGALMLAQLDATLNGVAWNNRPGDIFRSDRGPYRKLHHQAQAFLRWADTGAYTPDGDGQFDIGTATAMALDRLRTGVEPANAGFTGPDDAGNGSLMRILPVALCGIGTPAVVLVQRAHFSSRITHADARCQVACALYVLIGARLIEGETDRAHVLAEAVGELERIYAHRVTGIGPEHQEALMQLTDRHQSVSYGRGHVLDTFWSAWEAFAGANSYRETVERAVRYGHDTDTTAAIAGGLAGIYWAVPGLPIDWLDALRGQDVVEPLIAGQVNWELLQ